MPGKNKAQPPKAAHEITFTARTDIYPQEAVTAAALHLIDDWYVFLGDAGGKGIKVSLRAKTPSAKTDLEYIRGEFFNIMLAEALRLKSGARTKKFREFALQQAVAPAFSQPEKTSPKKPNLEAELKKIIEKASTTDFADDPLGIAKPVSSRTAKPAAKSNPKAGRKK